MSMRKPSHRRTVPRQPSHVDELKRAVAKHRKTSEEENAVDSSDDKSPLPSTFVSFYQSRSQSVVEHPGVGIATATHQSGSDGNIKKKWYSLSKPDLPFEIRPYLVLLGSVLIILGAGNVYSFGNMVPYFASYLTHTDPSTDYVTNVGRVNFIFSASFTSIPLGCVAGGYLEVHFGEKVTGFTATTLAIIGTGLTYFTCANVYLTALTYGIIFGLSAGITYTLATVVSLAWFPHREGTVSGLVLLSYCGAPFLFCYLQTGFVNPNNEALSSTDGFYDATDVIERIPFLFLVLGVTCGSLLFLGTLLLSRPELPPYEPVSDVNVSASPDSEAEYAQLNSSLMNLEYKTPQQAFGMVKFYHLLLIEFLFSTVCLFVSQGWKEMGSEYVGVENDRFLSLVGACGNLMAGVARFLWGIVYDCSNQSFRLSMALLLFLQAIALFTVCLIPIISNGSAAISEICLMLWVLLLFFCNGYYAFLPNILGRTFGAKYRGALMGCIFLAEIPATYFDSFLLNGVNSYMNGWDNVMIVLGGCAVLCWILGVTFEPMEWSNLFGKKKTMSPHAALKQTSHNKTVQSYDAVTVP